MIPLWWVACGQAIVETKKHSSRVSRDMIHYYTNRVDAEYGLLELDLQELNNDN